MFTASAEPPVLHTWRPYDAIEFRVRCERRLHRIRIEPDGRLVLVDHDMEMEALARALGGDEMRCPAVIDRFRSAVKSGHVGALPDKARPHIYATQSRRHARLSLMAERRALAWSSTTLDAIGVAVSAAPKGATVPHAWVGQRSKQAYLTRYVRRLLSRSVLATAAPKGAEPYATPHAVQVTVSHAQYPPHEVVLDVHGRQGFGLRTALRGTVPLHEHWWARVHKAGMDLIDGRLVLDAPALDDDHGVVYSFAGMTPRARKRARRKARAEEEAGDQTEEAPTQLALPDVMGETRTATVCVLTDPDPAGYPSDRWRLRLTTRWFKAVAERGAPWRLDKPLETWQVPTSS